MNDGAITAQTINGSLTINVGYSSPETVRYWSDYSRAVSGVTHTLEGNGTQTTTGAADGTYRFENLPGVAYSVTPKKPTKFRRSPPTMRRWCSNTPPVSRP